jgi:3-oxoacyl-[acyl-carrier-protein] synthase-1
VSAAVAVSGIGAVTPVGAGAAQTCASVRAGLSGLRRHPSYFPILPEPIEDEPEPAVCGVAAGEPTLGGRAGRLVGMSVAAARDLIVSAGLTRAQASALEIVACVGGAGRGGAPIDPGDFAAELPRRLGIALRRPARAALADPPAVFQAIAEAGGRLAAGEAERCLVLAADTLVDEGSLAWLDERSRLRSARSADGFLPGEAAACFLLEREDVARARGGSVLGRIAGAGLGDEPNPLPGERNSTGRGLCEAIRKAAAGWRERPIPWVICDMNGESYWAYEWGVACARLGPTLGSADLWHPADCTGGIGTAAPALAVVLAARAFACDYAPAERVLLWCASDGSPRGACGLTSATAT